MLTIGLSVTFLGNASASPKSITVQGASPVAKATEELEKRFVSRPNDRGSNGHPDGRAPHRDPGHLRVGGRVDHQNVAFRDVDVCPVWADDYSIWVTCQRDR